MPTYRNANPQDVLLNGQYRVGAGETLTIKEWLKNLPANVTEVTTAPYFNPIIDSAVITSTTTKTIPAGTSSYGIRVYCVSGACTVTLSSASNTPVLNLLAGESWEMVMHNRLVDTVIITIASSANVNYTVFTAGTCQFNC